VTILLLAVPLQVVDEVGPATCLQFGQAWLLIGLILFNVREEICRVNEKEALILLQQNEKTNFFVDDRRSSAGIVGGSIWEVKRALAANEGRILVSSMPFYHPFIQNEYLLFARHGFCKLDRPRAPFAGRMDPKTQHFLATHAFRQSTHRLISGLR